MSLEILVDSQYPGDINQINQLISPLIEVSSIRYFNTIQSTGLGLTIYQRDKYKLQFLDGTKKLDGSLLLSGYEEPSVPN